MLASGSDSVEESERGVEQVEGERLEEAPSDRPERLLSGMWMGGDDSRLASCRAIGVVSTCGG